MTSTFREAAKPASALLNFVAASRKAAVGLFSQTPRHFTYNNGTIVAYQLAGKESAGDFWTEAERIFSIIEG